MIAAVTGASGHLGNCIVRCEADNGTSVKAIARSDPGNTIPADVRWYPCDIASPNALIEAFEGVDIVYHAAGYVSIGLNDRKKLYEVNVRGSRNVVEACIEAGVRKLVYISSIEAMDLVSGMFPEIAEEVMRIRNIVSKREPRRRTN